MHKKHADLKKPSLGKFARHEIALLGTNCDIIGQWADLLSKALMPASVVYADANHHPETISDSIQRWTDNQFNPLPRNTGNGKSAHSTLASRFSRCER